MLKHRIIPILLWDGQQVIKPVSFQRPYRKLGTMAQYIRNMEKRNVDELVILDVSASHYDCEAERRKLMEHTSNLYCPVACGGNVRAISDITSLLCSGADKVVIKTHTSIINEAAKKFGSQSIVYAMDFDTDLYSIKFITEICKVIEDMGAGEIILTDMKRDGTFTGYNLDLIRSVTNAVRVPIVAAGGCSGPDSMLEALNAGASAVAASSIFLYTDHTPKSCAEWLSENGASVRV